MILKKIHFVTVQKIATWDGRLAPAASALLG